MQMLNKTTALLKGLNMLNWLIAGLFALFVAGLFVLPYGPRLLALLDTRYGPENSAALTSILVFEAALILPTAYAVHRIFTRTIAIVVSAREGNPFIRENAGRLRQIGFALLLIQVIDLFSGAGLMKASIISGQQFGWSPALTGWLAALLLFVLARIFEHGADLRDDLEGTV
jgi:hypothetical protein